jgi:hypothetical protein
MIAAFLAFLVFSASPRLFFTQELFRMLIHFDEKLFLAYFVAVKQTYASERPLGIVIFTKAKRLQFTTGALYALPIEYATASLICIHIFIKCLISEDPVFGTWYYQSFLPKERPF